MPVPQPVKLVLPKVSFKYALISICCPARTPGKFAECRAEGAALCTAIAFVLMALRGVVKLSSNTNAPAAMVSLRRSVTLIVPTNAELKLGLIFFAPVI